MLPKQEEMINLILKLKSATDLESYAAAKKTIYELCEYESIESAAEALGEMARKLRNDAEILLELRRQLINYKQVTDLFDEQEGKS